MPQPVQAPTATKRINIYLRLALFFAFLYIGDRLTGGRGLDEVGLPAPVALLTLIGYVTFLLMGPGLIANAMCDLYDRFRDRRAAPRDSNA